MFKAMKRSPDSSKTYKRISTTIGFVHGHETLPDLDENNR